MEIASAGSPEQSSLSLTRSLKHCITQMHNRGLSLIVPRQVHAEDMFSLLVHMCSWFSPLKCVKRALFSIIDCDLLYYHIWYGSTKSA